ncbi:MAG: DUF1648 domain-containing protein [Kiritimatiellales bacterium]|nr:DUF1648 domain-containing protein [Kiritimatiellales bacterium]
MRILFIASFIANVLLTLVSLVLFPERMAIHFGAGGAPNGWATGYFNAFLMILTELVLFCSLYFTPLVVLKIPARWINLPNKNYWLTEKNRPKAAAMITGLMWQFGTAMFLFLFFTGVLALQANLSDPVRFNEQLFMPVFVLFMLYSAYWCLRIVLTFRIPDEHKMDRFRIRDPEE